MASCPECGEELQDISGDPNIPADWAPFISLSCGRAWWPSELTSAARKLWDSKTRSHGSSQAARDLDKARYKDRDYMRIKKDKERKVASN